MTISLLVKVLISVIPLGASKKSSVCNISSALEKLPFRPSLMMRARARKDMKSIWWYCQRVKRVMLIWLERFLMQVADTALLPFMILFLKMQPFFLALFYKLLVGEKSSPWILFKNAMTGLSQGLPRLSRVWSFYEYGETCFIQE